MGTRLDIENPFYGNDASGSAFGWDFQVNAAIFLFLKYIDEIQSVKVEGKFQDIEIKKVDNSCIYAQAKSIQDGSLLNRMAKLEDAIISLAKTPAAADDSLLYISNYSAPLKDENVFRNQIVELKNVAQEKEIFILQKTKLEEKLKENINSLKLEPKNKTKVEKLEELLKRIIEINVDKLLISSIHPYIDTVQPMDKYKIISETIQNILVNKFGIVSQYIQKFVREILALWHETFLCNETCSNKDKEKTMNKIDLLWQIVIIISNIDVDMCNLFEEELEEDQLDEFEKYYSDKLYIHERFEFMNRLESDLRNYKKLNKEKKDIDFIKSNWRTYILEFSEFSLYDSVAQEYLIKKCLYKLIKNKNNIDRIIKGK